MKENGDNMDSIDIRRRENARALAVIAGGKAKFARKVGLTDSRVSQLMGDNYTRNIGRKVADMIEDAFEKKRGWLDHEHKDNEESSVSINQVEPQSTSQPEKLDLMYATQEEIRLVTAFREANEMGRNMFITAMKNAPRDVEKLKSIGRPK
jgi:hypothetical protein